MSSSSSSSFMLEYPLFMESTLHEKEHAFLFDGSVHQRHTWIRDMIRMRPPSPPSAICILSTHTAAKTSFGEYGDSLYGYLDLQMDVVPGSEPTPPSLEYIATLALHQHRCLEQSETRRVQTRKTPRSARYPTLPFPTQVTRRYPTSLLERLSEVQVFILLDISTWTLAWFDHLNFLCKFAKNSKAVFGGAQVIVEGEVFRPGPMEAETLKLVYQSEAWQHLFHIRHTSYQVHDSTLNSTNQFLQLWVRDKAILCAEQGEDLVIPMRRLLSALETRVPGPSFDHTLSITMSKVHAFDQNKTQLNLCMEGPFVDACRPRWTSVFSPAFMRTQASPEYTLMADGCYVGKKPSALDRFHQDDLLDVYSESSEREAKSRWYETLQEWLEDTYHKQLGMRSCFFGKIGMQVRIYTKTQKTRHGVALPWGIRAILRFVEAHAVVTLLDPLDKTSVKRLKKGEVQDSKEEEEEEEEDVTLQLETIHLKHKDFDTLHVSMFPFVAHYASNFYEWQGSSALDASTQLNLYCSARMPSYPGVIFGMLQLVETLPQVTIEAPKIQMSISSQFEVDKPTSQRSSSSFSSSLAQEDPAACITYPSSLCQFYVSLLKRRFCTVYPCESQERALRWAQRMADQQREDIQQQATRVQKKRHRRLLTLPPKEKQQEESAQVAFVQAYRQKMELGLAFED